MQLHRGRTRQSLSSSPSNSIFDLWVLIHLLISGFIFKFWFSCTLICSLYPILGRFLWFLKPRVLFIFFGNDKLEMFKLCFMVFKFDMKICIPFCCKMKYYCNCTYRMVGIEGQWWVEKWVGECFCFVFLLVQVLCCWNLIENIHKVLKVTSKFGHCSEYRYCVKPS